MKCSLIVATLVLGTRLLAGAQAGVELTTVTGRAIADHDDTPVAGVLVSVRFSGDDPAVATLTDGNGRFEVSVPKAENYQFTARKAGFFLFTETAGDSPDDFRLRQGAVLTGRVVDDTGEPVVQAKVGAALPDGTAKESTLTDDRGEYRLFTGADEEVVLAVTTQGSERMRMTGNVVRVESPAYTTYYPGTATVDRATAIALQPGEVRSGLDFTVSTEQSLRQPYRGLESVANFLPPEATPSAGSAPGVIQGSVFDITGRPIGNALVLLAPERGGSAIRVTRTDETGAFEFRQVAAGPVRIMASRSGFAADEARPVVPPQPQRPNQTELRLTPWAVISGRVLNEYGEPVQEARVQIMRTRYAAGRRMLVPAGVLDPVTDDRGMFRVYGLDPGNYIVTAELGTANAGEADAYPRSYYPGTVSAAAAIPVALGTGQSLNDIDLLLSRTPTYRIVGQIVAATGNPTTVTNVQLWPSQRDGSVISVPMSVRVGPDGGFEFLNVADGRYVLQAYRGRLNSTTEGEFGATEVVVNGQPVTDVVIATATGSTISGSIVLDTEGIGREPARASLEVSPVPGDLDLAPAANWATAGVGPDWRFAFSGVTGPRRLVPTQVPPGWTVKEVRVNGVDIGDRPLPFGTAEQSIANVEIVLTDRPFEVRGRVEDASGAAASRLSIVVFSPERDRWYPLSRYVRRVAVQNDGSFSIGGLTTSGYYVAVTESGASSGDDSWQDPAALESLISRATFVMVDGAPRTPLTLRRP